MRVARVFAPDGRTIALAMPDRQAGAYVMPLSQPDRAFVCVLDAANLSELRRITIDRFDVASVAFSPDGRLIAAGIGDRTIRLFDAATGAERLPRINSEHAEPSPEAGRDRFDGL